MKIFIGGFIFHPHFDSYSKARTKLSYKCNFNVSHRKQAWSITKSHSHDDLSECGGLTGERTESKSSGRFTS